VELGERRAYLRARVAAAQELRAEPADRLTALVDRDERVLVLRLLFSARVRSVAG